jgi:hypothetical protein
MGLGAGGGYAHFGDTAKKEDDWITGRRYRKFRRSEGNIFL